ncbi:hypothetical protein KP509_21G069000 [Ceratopteris richardii]|uniref:Uncharacterized protein n=1 Tax=Ceratopteris richardii TaxID=49495 RepID=A0A8T2SE55_CERRI|nr:hypothetical protein KP509_21G069000 [Ceratopteris richardii]
MTSNRVHQLSNGLYVSGAPDKQKDKPHVMTSTAMPYTGGDIKKSGELGKMFDIPVEAPRFKKSGPIHGGAPSAGPYIPATSYSGPLNSNGYPAGRSSVPNVGPPTSQAGGRSRQAARSGPIFKNGEPASSKNAFTYQRGLSSGSNPRNSGPLSGGGAAPGMVRQNSGPLTPNLPATGLITSGPITSGPLSSSKKLSGSVETGTLAAKFSGNANNQAINVLSNAQSYSFKRSFPPVILWAVVPLFLIGFVAGGFILATVQNAILLIVVTCLLCAILLLLAWNSFVGQGAVTGFMDKYPDVDLSQAKDGHYVKITGVVTCGSIPLETSYQKVPRCVYTSSGLYEYMYFKGKPASANHLSFTWGLRHLEASVMLENNLPVHFPVVTFLVFITAWDDVYEEGEYYFIHISSAMQRQAVDFYISDPKSGLRALVKAGYGAIVTPYVEENTLVNITKTNKEIPSQFLKWISDRNLSSDDRVMKFKEGYIKEGFIVTVMGVVQRNENVLMIVPPSEPVSTGCQWSRFLLPATMAGLLLRCENDSKADIIPV